MAKEKELRKLPMSQVKTFKIKNRKGYAAICLDNLTEGSTVKQAIDRLERPLKRMGLTLG
jgi:hypothetical protein